MRILARATRTTFTWLFRKHRPDAEVKRTVCARFGILARHWSGCRATSRAAAKSWREGGTELLATLTTRLARLRERWPKDCLRPERKRRNAVARRKAETAITRLSKDLEGDPRWCFGGRRLLRQGRLHDWRRRRDSEALFCGESTKTAGNEVAQWSANGNLKLRLPNTCARKYLILRNVRFSRAQQSVIESAVEAARPVTWRVKLLRRGKVQLCATLEELEPAVASDAAGGAVGVDMNRSHLAVVDVSPEGRPTCARARSPRLRLGCRVEGRQGGRPTCGRSGLPDHSRTPRLPHEEGLAALVRQALCRGSLALPLAPGARRGGAGGAAQRRRGALRRPGLDHQAREAEVPAALPPGNTSRRGARHRAPRPRFRRTSAR